MDRLFHTKKQKPIKHQTLIFILVSSVILISIGIFNLLLSNYIENNTKETLREKILNIARLAAHSDRVIDGLQNPGTDEEIQTYSNEVMELTDVGFVVILDMNLIRHSHPSEEEIGKSFHNREDASDSLKGKEYSSIEEGALGLGMRVFTPIYDESQNQIGVVVVGNTMDTVKSELQQGRKLIFISVLFQLIFGFLGAYVLSRKIKNILLGLEPIEIAQLVKEHQVLLESVKEGIVVVNDDGKISLVNTATLKLMELQHNKEILGQPVDHYIPIFNKVIELGVPEYDYEQNLHDKSLLINCAPITVNDKVIGAIATLRDKTELKLLYEELSGIRNYTETIRAQSHEFKNTLHVIVGLIHMEKYEKLKEFIPSIIEFQAKESDYIVKRIKDSTFAGFLIGKMSKARELGISLTIDDDTKLKTEFDQAMIHNLITITGSLIENAFDAVNSQQHKDIDLLITEIDGRFYLKITDNGEGIPENVLNNIFQKKFSTKGQHRGYGLYLTKQIIDKLAGKLEIDSTPNLGTTVNVRVELPRRESIDHD